jgi:GNAT superfamily N-acetyltransferase
MVDHEDSIVGYYTSPLMVFNFPNFRTQSLADYRDIPFSPLLCSAGWRLVSRTHQGKGVGRFLLIDALYRSWRNTSEVASMGGVVVDALDDKALAFYAHHAFMQFRDCPNRLFRAMADIERASRGR